MIRLGLIPAIVFTAAAVVAAPAGDEDLEGNVETDLRAIAPGDPALPQWRAADIEAFAAGHPVNLGGGLWTEERFPLESPSPEVLMAEAAKAEAAEFLRAVDLGALDRPPAPIVAAAGSEAVGDLRALNRPPNRLRWTVAALFGLATAAASRRLFHHHHRPRHLLFPSIDPAPRLGGTHCGGAGAVLRW